MTEPKNVVTALAAVIAEMPAIGKDAQASAQQGGYSYRGIEAITSKVQPLLAKHCVIFAPEVIEWTEKDITVNGKPWTDQRLKVKYTIYGPGGRDDFITATVAGLGRDNSDKGSNKAMSQAFKYLLLQTLCIADPKDDGDKETHEAEVQASPKDWVADAVWQHTEQDVIEAAESVRAAMGTGNPITGLGGVRPVKEGSEPHKKIIALLEAEGRGEPAGISAILQEGAGSAGDEGTTEVALSVGDVDDSPASPPTDPAIKARVLAERNRHRVRGGGWVTCQSRVTFSGECEECGFDPENAWATLPPVEEPVEAPS